MRPFTVEDAAAHEALYADPLVTRMLPGGPFPGVPRPVGLNTVDELGEVEVLYGAEARGMDAGARDASRGGDGRVRVRRRRARVSSRSPSRLTWRPGA